MSGNTDLESYLAKLLLIKNGLILADGELLKLAKEHQQIKTQLTGFSRPNPQLERRLVEISEQAKICIEGTIVELFNLSEVRTKFLNNIQNTTVKKILDALKPCSDVLDANDRLIRELRNNVTAHGEIQGQNFRGTTDIFQSQQAPYRKIFLSAKCGCMFTEGLIDNLALEVVKAKEIVKIHMNGTNVPVSDYFGAISDARAIQAIAITNLTTAYLNREISFVGQ